MDFESSFTRSRDHAMVNRLFRPVFPFSRQHLLARLGAAVRLAVVGWLMAIGHPLLAQTFTFVPQSTTSSTAKISNGTPTSTMMLLTDGSVMVHNLTSGTPSEKWYRLRPDPNGGYASNSITWSDAAPMSVKRFMFASWVIPNGKLVVAGGLQTAPATSGSYGTLASVEIYDPQVDKWTQSTATYPGTNNTILNAPSVLLPSGQILFGDVKSANTYLYNPNSDSWSTSGQKALNTVNSLAGTTLPDDGNDGQAFTLLSNNNVLTWPIKQNLYVLPPATVAWAPGTNYNVGNLVVSNQLVYYCVTAGTSTVFAGPTTTPWAPTTAYAVGATVTHTGKLYLCVTAGTSGMVGPSGTNPPQDGTVTWRYQIGVAPTGKNPPQDGTVTWQYQKAYGQLYSNGNWSLTAQADVESFIPSVVATTGRLTDLTYNYTVSSTSALSLGPASVMPDGSVIQFGANGSSAIFSGGAWSAGPQFPSGKGPDCAPGAMMPNGQFLIAVDNAPGQSGPNTLYTYDYLTKTLSSLSGFSSGSAANMRMLVLPNGHVLINSGAGYIYDLLPSGSPTVGIPTISAVTPTTSATTYTLTGTLLTGISAGACYGANADAATNYPIVQLTNTTTGRVQYARTYNWTPKIHAAGDATTATCSFDVPSNFTAGSYNLNLIANGIPSASQAFNYTAVVTRMGMTYDSVNQVLSLTALDNNNHIVTVTLKNQVLTVAGSVAAGSGSQNITTDIVYNGNTATTQTIHFGTNVKLATSFTMSANFGSGADTLVINGLTAKSLSIGMGGGNDTCSIYYTTLSSGGGADGGAGTDTFGQAASKLTGFGISGFETVLPP